MLLLQKHWKLDCTDYVSTVTVVTSGRENIPQWCLTIGEYVQQSSQEGQQRTLKSNTITYPA